MAVDGGQIQKDVKRVMEARKNVANGGVAAAVEKHPAAGKCWMEKQTMASALIQD